MILLFEGYHYDAALLDGIVSKHFCTPLSDGRMKVDYVGYYFNVNDEDPAKTDVVFIVPKVFLNGDSGDAQAFELEGAKPEELLDMDEEKCKVLKERGVQQLLFNLSVWIYQSLQFYYERKQSRQILAEEKMQDVISNKGDNEQTYLDTILQLKEFYRQHKNMLTYISIIKASGNNKIHWAKTISKETPIICDNQPAYVSFRTKQKMFNFDEELIVLFYSVLDYLKTTMHFYTEFNVNYTLMSHREVERLIKNGRGTRLLKRIRKKYFKDEFVALWKLLYVFFEKSERIANRRYHEETLLAKDYDRVFEDMVDYLISEENVPEELKTQMSGKFLVDHLYPDESLFYKEKIYYVGDSKYYRVGTNANDHDIEKQYAYAKNIIQRNIDVICGFSQQKNQDGYYRYRDELTEGYNITPNFFISGIAKRGEGGKYVTDAPELKPAGDELIRSRHFENRLFDRDTLVLQKFDINFLFVLTVYARQNSAVRDQFKAVARKEFREAICKLIRENYAVYQVLLPKNTDIEAFVREHFYYLQGRTFSYGDGSETIILYAEENNGKVVGNTTCFLNFGTDGLHVFFQRDSSTICELEPIHFGDTIKKKYADTIIMRSLSAMYDERIFAAEMDKLPQTSPIRKYEVEDDDAPLLTAAEDVIELYKRDISSLEGEDDTLFPILIGYTSHIDWVKEHGLYNMRSGEVVGAVDSFLDLVKASKTLMLYTDKKRMHSEMFACSYSRLASKDEMKNLGYKEPKGDYHLCEVKPMEKKFCITLADLETAMNAKQHKEFWSYKMVVILE